jgi:integrase
MLCRRGDVDAGTPTIGQKVGVIRPVHALRHFTASALIAGGASVKQVQMVLGHSSAAITLRVYSHLWPGDEDRTRSVMDAALSVLRTGCGLGEEVSDKPAGQNG